MKSRILKRHLLDASEGILANVTDFVLFEFFCLLCTPGRHSSFQLEQATRDAEKILEDVNYQSIKNALYTLTKIGFVKRSAKRSHLELEITKEGMSRLNSLLPAYRANRPWDGYLYLISYDIPTNANTARDILRNYMKRIGCALLQESLWLTPYNPTAIVESFVRDRAIPGTILVSKLGKDGSIGDETREKLINRIYHLDALARQYNNFIEQYSKGNHHHPLLSLSLVYFSILKDDPQLPFALEPKDFPAKAAYLLYRASFSSKTDQ